MVLLDTNALLWLRSGDARLGAKARLTIDRALQEDELAISAISFWEAAMLRDKGRLRFPDDLGLWRRELLAQGVIEIPIDGDIAARAGALRDIHGDPADRLIVATGSGRTPARDQRRQDSRMAGGLAPAGREAVIGLALDTGGSWHRWLYCCASGVQRELKRRASGRTFREMSRVSVRSLLVPLPPLPEQRAIAAVLDAIGGGH